MTDKQRMASWKRVRSQKRALEILVEQWSFIGTDPYYHDLDIALYEMATRVLEKQ